MNKLKQYAEQYVNGNENEAILECLIGEKPFIRLEIFSTLGVATETKSDYIELLRVFELGGWTWAEGETPTTKDYWKPNEPQVFTCGWDENREFQFLRERYAKSAGYSIIPKHTFYEKQNLTPETIQNVHHYFEKND